MLATVPTQNDNKFLYFIIVLSDVDMYNTRKVSVNLNIRLKNLLCVSSYRLFRLPDSPHIINPLQPWYGHEYFSFVRYLHISVYGNMKGILYSFHEIYKEHVSKNGHVTRMEPVF